MKEAKPFNLNMFVNWLLFFVILVALGLAGWQSYCAIKIQEDMYSRIWATIKPQETDKDGNEIPKTTVVYKMNIYDYTDCVLVNMPLGSNDCWFDGALDWFQHNNWNRSKAYLKFAKDDQGELKYDGVILYSAHSAPGNKYWVQYCGVDTKASKELSQYCFEYILTGNLKTSWSKNGDNVIFIDQPKITNYDYMITFQQQTTDSLAQGGIFGKIYNQLQADLKNNPTSEKTFTRQFMHDTTKTQYIKAFRGDQCINANIYCEYTMQINTHNLPTELSNGWYNEEILGGNK